MVGINMFFMYVLNRLISTVNSGQMGAQRLWMRSLFRKIDFFRIKLNTWIGLIEVKKINTRSSFVAIFLFMNVVRIETLLSTSISSIDGMVSSVASWKYQNRQIQPKKIDWRKKKYKIFSVVTSIPNAIYLKYVSKWDRFNHFCSRKIVGWC